LNILLQKAKSLTVKLQSAAVVLSVKQRFSRDVLWNIGSLGVLNICGFIVNIFIMAFRGPQALGVFSQVFAIYLIASQVSVLGLQFSVLKHCSHEHGDLAECSAIVSSALILVACWSSMICIILFSFRDIIGRVLGSSLVATGLSFAIPGLFFYSMNKVLLMTLNGLREMRAFAVFQALRYILISASIIAMLILGYRGPHLPLSLTMTEMALFGLLMLYVNSRILRLHFLNTSKIRRWFGRHILFGSKGFLSGVLVEMNTRVDVLMLGHFMSDTVVGIYSFASICAEIIAQIPVVVRQNLDPIIGRCFAVNNKKKISEIAKKVRHVFSPIMVLIGFTLIMTFPILLKIVGPGGKNWQSWGVFAILLSGTILTAGYSPFLGMLIQGGRPEIYTMLIGGSIAGNIILNACLIPVLGIYGAAVATACIYVLEIAGLTVLVRRTFGIRL